MQFHPILMLGLHRASIRLHTTKAREREEAPSRGGEGASFGWRNARRWSATSCSPTGLPRSTIGARGLNFRVRNGTGCASPAMVADQRRAFCFQGRALGAAQRDLCKTTNPPDRILVETCKE